MSPEEKIETEKRLIAEAEAEIAAKKRNWPEKIEAGMLFQHDGGAIYIFPARDCDDLLCVVGDKSDCPGDYYSRDLLCSEPQSMTYLGHTRDLIKITDAAPEPTGAELVGKICEFRGFNLGQGDPNEWFGPWECVAFDPDDRSSAYRTDEVGKMTGWYKEARIARPAR